MARPTIVNSEIHTGPQQRTRLYKLSEALVAFFEMYDLSRNDIYRF